MLTLQDTILPDKLSDLLELALNDLEVIEKNPAYMINMGEWHRNLNDVCHVCLAGAVMANTLKMLPMTTVFITQQAKFLALNIIRCGRVDKALKLLGVPHKVWKIKVPPYMDDPVVFKQRLRNLIPRLREKGF